MALALITNSVGRSAVQTQVTDGSDALTSDQTGVNFIRGGARCHYWTQTGTDARRLVYVNKTNKFSFDTVILARADLHSGRDVKISSWSTYTTTKTDHVSSASWAPTLTGPGGTDFIQTGLTVTNAEAAGLILSSTYAKTVHQLFFGTAFSFTEPPLSTFDSSPVWDRIQIRRQPYLIRARHSFVIPRITAAQLQTLEQNPAYTEEPLFLYDSSGAIIPDKLLHGILTAIRVDAIHDDFYTVAFDFAELRRYAPTPY